MSTVFKDKLSTVLPDMIYIIWGRLVILPGTIMVSLYYYYGTTYVLIAEIQFVYRTMMSTTFHACKY